MVSLTYASDIESGSTVLISFPKWDTESDGATSPNSVLSSSISCKNNDTSTSVTCSYTTGTSFNNDVLTVSGLITSTKSSGSTSNILIQNFINYPLMRSYSVSIDVDNSGGYTLNTISGVTMTPTTAAVMNSTAISSLTSSTVSATSVYFISIKLNTVLPIGSYVRVTLPSEISNTDTSGSNIFSSVSVSSVLNSPTIDSTGLSSSPQYFDLKNMVTSSSNYRTKGQTFYLQITSLRNPPSVATSSSFTIGLYDSSNNNYSSKSSGITITSDAGALSAGTSPTMNATSTAVLDYVNFTLSLQAATAISSGASGSVVITFPSAFTLTTGT